LVLVFLLHIKVVR